MLHHVNLINMIFHIIKPTGIPMLSRNPWGVSCRGTYPNRTRASTRCIALALTQEVFQQAFLRGQSGSSVELWGILGCLWNVHTQLDKE